MGVTIAQDSDNVYVMRITGMLKKSELDGVQASATKMLDSDPLIQVKLLMVVEEFQGWERDADWGDMSFYAKHGDRIARIAIVGDPRRETDWKMFVGAGFRTAPVRFFAPSQLDRARQWLAES